MPKQYYQQRIIEGNPRYLGFFCQEVLASYKGKYDYYCYMEDDLIIHDPFFFWKLSWFENEFGPQSLLQPHRYECIDTGMFYKGYIDPAGYDDLSVAQERDVMQHIVDYKTNPILYAKWLNQRISFVKAINPHSGCFFLSTRQFEEFSGKEAFAKPTEEFVGPLESAATLGIAKTFSVYKPSFGMGAFFELEHADARYLCVKIKENDKIDKASFENRL